MGVLEGEAQPLILLQGALVREAPVHGAHHVGLLLAVADGGLGHVHWLPSRVDRGHGCSAGLDSIQRWMGRPSSQGALRPGASLEASLDAEGTLFTSFAHQTGRAASSPPRGTGRGPRPGHLC